MPSTFGWLFDVYPSGDGMTVWLIDEQGQSYALRDTFAPSFYAHGPREELRAVCQMLRARHAPVKLRRTERLDLFLDRPLEVLEVSVRIPSMLTRLFRQTADYRPDLTYYDADIPLPQRYALARHVFPLAYCHVDHRDGELELPLLQFRPLPAHSDGPREGATRTTSCRHRPPRPAAPGISRRRSSRARRRQRSSAPSRTGRSACRR